MKIQLTEKQLQVLTPAFREQQLLQEEHQKIQKRIDDVIFVILDTHGVSPVRGMEIKDNVLVVPDAPQGPELHPQELVQEAEVVN